LLVICLISTLYLTAGRQVGGIKILTIEGSAGTQDVLSIAPKGLVEIFKLFLPACLPAGRSFRPTGLLKE
jgi:hypothetical protein